MKSTLPRWQGQPLASRMGEIVDLGVMLTILSPSITLKSCNNGIGLHLNWIVGPSIILNDHQLVEP